MSGPLPDRARLLGESAPMRELRHRLERVARTPLPVLILGETGTGKEVAARSLHASSGRRGPFVAVDCAAISRTLVETELFGHERGAFTGATHRRQGLVASARGGTFFLDEVGDLPAEAQTRLLRLLEGGTFRPVGAREERRADIRVVAATWRDLRDGVRRGTFREDLYHRLGSIELTLPPLRQRGPDIDILFDAFLQDAVEEMSRPRPRLTGAARAHLRAWPWPGNVRELRNVARYVVAMTDGPRVGLDDLPAAVRRSPPARASSASSEGEGAGPFRVRVDIPYMEARRACLDRFQESYVFAILEAHDGNVSAAARAANMDRRSIQRVLARARARRR